MDDLYHELILELYRHPHNHEVMEKPDKIIFAANRSCGDSFQLYIQFDTSNFIIKRMSFSGQGCAISTAATSVLTEKLVGRPMSDAQSLTKENMEVYLGIEAGISPAREKCLMISLQALQQFSLGS